MIGFLTEYYQYDDQNTDSYIYRDLWSTGIVFGNIIGFSNICFRVMYRNWFIQPSRNDYVAPNFILNKNKQKKTGFIKNYSMVNNRIDNTGVRKSNTIAQTTIESRIFNSTKKKRTSL